MTGGQLRGMLWPSCDHILLRPTAVRVRRSLFDILEPLMKNAVFLDVFAGSGIIGAEALSRGASRVYFIERETGLVRNIQNNLRKFNLCASASVHCADVFEWLLRPNMTIQADILFFDPPYNDLDPDRILSSIQLTDAAKPIIIIEHHHRRSLPVDCHGLIMHRTQRYGETALSFYRVK